MMREPEAPAFSPVSSRVAQVLDIKLKFPVSVLFEAMFPVGIVPGSRKLADFVLLDEQIWFVGVAPCAGAWIETVWNSTATTVDRAGRPLCGGVD